MIMNVKAHLLSWLANCDTQALVDQDLLNLQKYITSYACKGAAATQDLVTIYGHLLDSADPNASVKSIVLRLLNRILGKIDTPAACCDFINSGGKLWHCTRKFQSVGLSGYRPLTSKPDGENFTQKIAIDKFLSNERREKNPTMTLYDWVRECSCRTKCTADHCPVFTGIQVNPVWPLSEDYCKGKLMMFSPGVWTKPEDLKLEGETFGEAFARFLDTDQCPRVVKDNVKSAKKRYDEKMERERKRRHKLNEQHNDNANQESQADSQYSFSSSTFSQDSQMREVNVANELLNELHDANPSNAVDEELEVPLLDGGPDFDWHEYAMQCLGQTWPDNVGSWLDDMDAEVEKQTVNSYGRCDLPRINLLLANELQRLIIAINLERMILLQKGENYEPLRLLVQGTAGTGKTFVINSLSFIARRLRQRNNAVLNLAPTGTASLLLPGGRTVHSITPPLSKSKTNDLKSAQMSDYPLKGKALKKLCETIGYKNKGLELAVLNMDERSMFSKGLLGWTSERFSQATNNYDNTFGAIPVVNFFGDLGQLGPVKKLDLHLRPAKNASPDELAGFAIYRNFQDVIVLNQTMRQKECEKMFLERLLRIRGGRITQQDWLAVNARYEKELPEAEKINYCNAEITITLHETWREVNKENRKNLANLNFPVATIPSTGRGYHHKNGDKQVGQIPPKATIAVNSKVILTKNQKAFTPYGLHNGAVGIVKAILYEKGTSPPQLPTAVIVYFPRYTGPAWDINNPKFIPITAVRSKCESECCSRTGLPLMPGYSLPIAKAQGITVGSNQPAEFMRVSIQEGKYMEQQSLGITYTALSRAESEDRWCLIDKIPQDRLHYINNHPQMQNRHQEEKRLNELSANTIARYSHLLNKSKYLQLLNEFDVLCNDGIITSVCTSGNAACTCVYCSLK
uniref:ATP-dependent DNA helicase n=2 Tax=Clytia hemisphaerica TaxID=252671 RepID=A0A7M5XH24_9CNID